MRPFRVSPSALRGVALEQRVLGFGVQRRGRLIEDQQQRLVAHEATGQRELLPLSERQLDSARPRRTELRVEARRQAVDDIGCAGAIDGRGTRRLVVERGQVAQPDRLPARGTRSGRNPERRRRGASRHSLAGTRASGVSSNRMEPEDGSYIFASSLTRVVLPAPFSPTMATTAPAGRVSDTSSSTTRDVPG